MQQKDYEVKCIALLKKLPHAINTPQLPSMYTPFLVRAEVNKLFSFQVMLLLLHVKSVVFLLFKPCWMTNHYIE
jgi:hypothetical protein